MRCPLIAGAALGLSLLFILSAQARIDDTETDLEQRYGKAKESKDGYNERHKVRLYEISDYIIMVDVLDGRSASEFFTRKGGEPFSNTEINTLLAANQLNGQWTNTMGNDLVGWWEYDLNHILNAYRDNHSGSFVIRSYAFRTFEKTARAESEKSKLKGF